MSWQACDWADRLPYGAVGPLAFRVLLKLANVAAEDGSRAFRDKPRIAHELGVSQRSVQRAYRELEHAALIRPGDQSFTHHIRADKRPTVYDLNFHWQVIVEQPQLSIDGETPTVSPYGETELSTPGSGETPGVQTGRQLLSHIERSVNTLNSSTRGDHRTRARDDAPLGRCSHGHKIIGHSGGGVPFCDLGCESAPALAGVSS